MKRAPCLEKGIGASLFGEVFEAEFFRFSIYWQPSRPPRTFFMLGFAGRTEYTSEITRSDLALVSMPELLSRWPACAGTLG